MTKIEPAWRVMKGFGNV